MDDTSLQDLENELKALRPRRPSVLLRARVEHELSHAESDSRESPRSIREAPRYASATTLRSWKWFSWQMAAAAAVALAVSVGVWRWQISRDTLLAASATAPSLAQSEKVDSPPIESTPASAPRALAAVDTYRPVKAANVLYDLKDEGPVMLDDNTPGRRIRARYVDTYTWKNPATNASLKWSVPRDEVRVLPASFH
ncbi:MAG: hypothetical protein KF715_16060 [Candidatus Didemnitutus sp.]|nr:hypothetical protein [Candidatus Didemnitutus sp.]